MVDLSPESIFAEMKYYLFSMPKEKILPETAIRPMFSFVRKRFDYLAWTTEGCLTGVEIGVHVARNSYNILTLLPIKRLFLIDPYAEYIQDGNIANPKTDTDLIYKKAKERLKEFDGKAVFLREYSGHAANEIPNELDFVYIDGNHSYEFVKEDIALYYPKVRKGGIIGGNDFDGGYLGVIYAVIEFCKENNLKLHAEKSDWWVVKE